MLQFLDMNKSRMFSRCVLLTSLFFGFTKVVSAQVALSEVMYDPPGTDTKREWVEVCNVSTSAVDLTSYTLFESSSNHGITAIAGGASLAQDTCAIVADDATTFKFDYPGFSGQLFDSSFSLSNSGELLVMRNGAGMDVDASSYTVTAAKGDGNTMHRSNSSWTGGPATPGTESGFSAPTGSASGTQGTTSTVDSTQVVTNGNTATPASNVTSVINFQTVTVEPPPKLTLRVTAPQAAATDTLMLFSAESFNAKGTPVKATVKWNFGDGMTDTGSEVRHAYAFDGTYVVRVTAVSDSLSDSADVSVTIHPLVVSLTISPDNKVIGIKNETSAKMDITAWKVRVGSQWSVFPDNTILAPKSVTKFGTTALKLTQFSSSVPVELLNSRSEQVARAFPVAAPSPVTSLFLSEPKSLFVVDSALGVQEKNETMSPAAVSLFAAVSVPTQTSSGQAEIAHSESIPVEPKKKDTEVAKVVEKKDIAKITSEPQEKEEISKKEEKAIVAPEVVVANPVVVQTAVANAAGTSFPINPWYVALGLLCLAAFAPTLLSGKSDASNTARPIKSRPAQGELSAKDFKIIDVSDDVK
jgi:hypothetical protein